MNRQLNRLLALVALLGLLGCTPRYGRGELVAERGYVVDELPLRVTAEGLDALDERWLVTSHQPNGAPRVGRGFLEIRRTDWNDDGRASRYWGYSHHLQLEQRTGAGEIWLQSVILEPDEESRALRHHADNVLAAIAEGKTQNVITLNDYGRPVTVRQVREPMEVQLLDRMDGQLDGQEAHLVIFRVSRGDAGAQMAMLFARAGFHYVQKGSFGKRRGWPVLLVVGYGNGPSDFDAGLPDFDRFIRSIEMESNADQLGLGSD